MKRLCLKKAILSASTLWSDKRASMEMRQGLILSVRFRRRKKNLSESQKNVFSKELKMSELETGLERFLMLFKLMQRAMDFRLSENSVGME